MIDLEMLRAFCEKIRLPEQVTKNILSETLEMSPQRKREAVFGLCDKNRYWETFKALESAFAVDGDPYGFRMLKIMLTAGLYARELYIEKNIDETVYVATMNCFSRFVNEYRQAYGVYGFDRGFWTGKQLSLSLFRLGELEYELTEFNGKKAISIHIPSGADLSEERINESLVQARNFLSEHFSEYAGGVFFCESWLLAPALKILLPSTSKIVRFAERFGIVGINENAKDYVQWVYKDPGLSAESFPEQTLLQKNMKQYVLSGGKVGAATGILK